MMLRTMAAVALLVSMAGCQTSPQRNEAPCGTTRACKDGSSPETAIVIKASNEREGVAEEYAWLRAHMTGAKVVSQSLRTDGGLFDVIEIDTPGGQRRNVYFDISSFFGKHGAASTSTAPKAVPALPSHETTDPMFQFLGVWEGRIELFDAPRFANGAGHTINVRFVINPDEVRVFTGKVGGTSNLDFDWNEVKPGQFAAMQEESQAVVAATTSGHDKDGPWVESSVYTLVHDSPKTMVVYWVRTVNNLDLKPDNPDHHFAWGGSGQFHQVYATDGAP